MGKRKPMSGLIKRGDVWHIDKQINGRRISKSTGATERRVAEAQLKQIMDDVFGLAQCSERQPLRLGKQRFNGRTT